MSHTWICAICGASASSKCPDARHTFEDDETVGLLRNLLATHVIPTSNGIEVFFNYTVYAETSNPLGYAIESLAKNADKIKRIACEHHWFIQHDSEETQTCTLDHEHPTTASALFKEAQKVDPDKAYEFKDMQREYAGFLRYVLNQLEKKARIAKYPDGKAQSKVSDDLEYIRMELGRMLKNWRSDVPVRPAVTMRQPGSRYDEPDVFEITCTDRHIGTEVYTLLRDKMFHSLRAYDENREAVPASETPIYVQCDRCGKPVLGRAIVVEGYTLRHQRCHDRLHKIVKRRVRIKPYLISEKLAKEIAYRNHSFGPDYDYSQKTDFTKNIRKLVRDDSAWRTEVVDFQWCGPETWELPDGRKRRHPGYCFIEIRGTAVDIETVVAELTTLSKGDQP